VVLALRARPRERYRWSMDISTDPQRIQLDVVYPWLRGSYWSPGIRRDVVERAFANSIVAGAYEDGIQIGVHASPRIARRSRGCATCSSPSRCVAAASRARSSAR